MNVAFVHEITRGEMEQKNSYIGLTDNTSPKKRHYGEFFPHEKTKVQILDQQERVFYTKRHGSNQLWGGVEGGLNEWFKINSVTVGTRVLIRYNHLERSKDGDPIIHLEII